MCFFFFSSRRRHTRSYGDWSSDVCSSDLGLACTGCCRRGPSTESSSSPEERTDGFGDVIDLVESEVRADGKAQELPRETRSEERRVGKECRVGWGAEHERENG